MKATLALHTNSNVDVNKIRVVKASQSDIIPNRCDTALKRVNDLHAEIGRMVKLIDELRADLLHLTVK